MIEVDLHAHSLFSHCGLHSIVEMLTEARRRGLKALAITDHAGADLGRVPSPFFDRLHQPVEGITLLKGMECNVLEKEGVIDLPAKFVTFMDVVLLGLHPTLTRGLGTVRNTELLIAALKRNPVVDIITHPNDATYPVDFGEVTTYCAAHGVTVEFNNSKTMLSRVGDEQTVALVEACKRARCRVAINSDAHALNEIGVDTSIRPIIAAVGFPEELIVNRDAEAGMRFVEECRERKSA